MFNYRFPYYYPDLSELASRSSAGNNSDGTGSDEDELYEHHRLTIDPGQEPVRLDKFLSNRLGQTSRNRIQLAMAAGNIRSNGAPVKPSYRVKPGDVISIVLAYPPREKELKPEAMDLRIVYEDEQVLVLDKPPGLVVHPGVGNRDGTLVNGLLWHMMQQEGNMELPSTRNKKNTDASPRPGLVHRIDKDTSGLLVVAKDELSLAHLARQFYEHSVDRSYVALVWGVPVPAEATLRGFMGRSHKDRKLQTVYRALPPDEALPENLHDTEEAGRLAVTHYRVLEEFGYASLLECRLMTGRTHQIRAHVRSIGHPVFNDARYGGDLVLYGPDYSRFKQFIKNCFEILPRQGLHARTLAFNHPLNGKRLSFESPLPADMASCIEKWRVLSRHNNWE